MEEKNMNPAESLEIIDSMIRTAKHKLADDGFLYIFWGWLVFISAIINYGSIVLQVPYGYWSWAILMPLGAIVSIVYGYRQNKKDKVKTYIDSYLSYLWTAFGISLALTLIFMQIHGIKTSYFFLMILYGIATLVSGGLLNFRPLVIGSIFSFIFAIVSVFLGELEQLLCISGAIMCSYIIPGHLLYASFRSQVNV